MIVGDITISVGEGRAHHLKPARPYMLKVGDGPFRCVLCGAEMATTSAGAGVWAITHGAGEARCVVRYPDDFLVEPDPIGRWLAALHEYERGQ